MARSAPEGVGICPFPSTLVQLIQLLKVAKLLDHRRESSRRAPVVAKTLEAPMLPETAEYPSNTG